MQITLLSCIDAFKAWCKSSVLWSCHIQAQNNKLILSSTPQFEPLHLNSPSSWLWVPTLTFTAKHLTPDPQCWVSAASLTIIPSLPPNRSDNRSPSAAPDAAVCQMGLAHMRPEGLQILPFPSLCSLSSLRSFSSACLFHSMPQYKRYSYKKTHTNSCQQTWKFD